MAIVKKFKKIDLLSNPTRYLFFTGKGGVGKTSLSTAVALALSDQGQSVLLVSTDAASNLDEILGIELRNSPVSVPGAPGLSVLNIDPNAAADAYRERVIAQMAANSTEVERLAVREQLSGACTTEIASFDEFSDLLATENKAFDHIIFDTAPTGHTIRLLSLPKAWTGFLKKNDKGASCLGPHSGLKMQETRFQAALTTLSDRTKTTVVLVTRPEKGAIQEAALTSQELRDLGFQNQRLVVNGVFHASDPADLVAKSIDELGQFELQNLPVELQSLPKDEVPLRAFDTIGLSALRAILGAEVFVDTKVAIRNLLKEKDLPPLTALVSKLAQKEHALVMVMGKGGVGKTTIAAALAVGLVRAGKSVHLSTTDPAAHLANTIDGALPGLKVSRIDPKKETQQYIDKVMASKGRNLNDEEKMLLLEDLKSPCTEEVAVFHAFSRIVSEARSSIVVLDTAPTGHSLLLMDATGAYHRQMVRELQGKIVTPLMRLQDSTYTHIILVTLPETTPISQAAALQEDLRRAKIEPYAWVVNKSICASETHDPILAARKNSELKQMERIESGMASNLYLVPWLARPPVGIEELSRLV